MTHELRSQILTLSDAEEYKFPDAPIHSAVIGLSPFCKRPGFDKPVYMEPDEQRIFIGLAYPVRLSQALMNAPHAVNNKFDFRSCANETIGPG